MLPENPSDIGMQTSLVIRRSDISRSLNRSQLSFGDYLGTWFRCNFIF